MKIKSIDIVGIGGIDNLHIEFDDHMNFICGPNGIGKTTVLECVAHSFSTSTTNILQRKASSKTGFIKPVIDIDNSMFERNISIQEFAPDKPSIFQGFYERADKLISLKVTRTFNYQPLDAVWKDQAKEISSLFGEAMSGVNINQVKNWFVNRFLYSAHYGSLTPEQNHNLELAKKCFSLLNENFHFSKVSAATNDIMINTPGGEIYYEYLSSGFKSCISILFGIIKEIEYRFKDPCIKADEFDGISLIDELELHLHPEWQAKIANILVKVFPNIQFITSTHSPHILQNAKPNEIIALELNNDLVVSRRELNHGLYGFQGWTVEEILTDVMGMNDNRTDVFQATLSKFNLAIEKENSSDANGAFNELDNLLHPKNYLRKLLKLELASIPESKE